MLDTIDIGLVLKTLKGVMIIGMMVVLFYHGRERKQSLKQLKEHVQKCHPKVWESWQYDPMKIGKNMVFINIQEWCSAHKAQRHSDEQLEQLKRAYLKSHNFQNKFSIYFGVLLFIFIAAN